MDYETYNKLMDLLIDDRSIRDIYTGRDGIYILGIGFVIVVGKNGILNGTCEWWAINEYINVLKKIKKVIK